MRVRKLGRKRSKTSLKLSRNWRLRSGALARALARSAVRFLVVVSRVTRLRDLPLEAATRRKRPGFCSATAAAEAHAAQSSERAARSTRTCEQAKRVNRELHARSTSSDAATWPAFVMSTDLEGLCSARCVRASLSVGDLHRKQLVRNARNVSGSIRDSRHLFDLALGASGFSVVPAFRISFAGLLFIVLIKPHPSTDTDSNLFDLLAAARSNLEPAYSE